MINESSITMGASSNKMGMGQKMSFGLAPWLEQYKWGGKPSEKKIYLQRVDGILKKYPEMHALWNSEITEYTVGNIVEISHGFAVDRAGRHRLVRDALLVEERVDGLHVLLLWVDLGVVVLSK